MDRCSETAEENPSKSSLEAAFCGGNETFSAELTRLTDLQYVAMLTLLDEYSVAT